jgi:hypothetical protein
MNENDGQKPTDRSRRGIIQLRADLTSAVSWGKSKS